MHVNVNRLKLVQDQVKEIVYKKQLKTNPTIIAVTKTFNLENITPLIDFGHTHFGENKIQEADLKWHNLKNKNLNLQLHMLGPIQSNKAKKVVQLFDYIHSLDSEKLAKKISDYENELKKKTKIFIQVNIGNEPQKSGIDLKNINEFYNYCTQNLSLDIIGLMCLPPVNLNSDLFFKKLKDESAKLNLNELSMGMSNDYENALLHGATFLRLGSVIMGERNSK
jgi:PLP dependent protein